MVDNAPLVSVGIPAYNRPAGLRKTLDQILNQTHKNLEIIISDNCSPDPEVEIVSKEFAQKDGRIKYYRQNENIGMVPNFQFVLRESKGEFYMWAADDDEWNPRFIETCLQYMGGADLSMQHNYKTAYRKTGHIESFAAIPFKETYSYYENLLTYFNGISMSLFYGLYRRKKILPMLNDPVMDGLEKLILIRFLLYNKVNTFDECLYTAGIDSEVYEVKPFFKLKGKLFLYTPYILSVFKVILPSNNLNLKQKIKFLSIFLDRVLHSFIKYEKPYRPIQVGIVEFILKSILYVKYRLLKA